MQKVCPDCGKVKEGSDLKVSYGRKCRLCWNARQRWLRQNTESGQAHRDANHRSYVKNPLPAKQRTVAWVEANRERWRKQKIKDFHKRRAVLANAEGTYSLEEWEEIKSSQGFKCLHCGKHDSESPLTVDHIIPISRGGSNWPSNLQGLCLSCNSSKSNKIAA